MFQRRQWRSIQHKTIYFKCMPITNNWIIIKTGCQDWALLISTKNCPTMMFRNTSEAMYVHSIPFHFKTQSFYFYFHMAFRLVQQGQNFWRSYTHIWCMFASLKHCVCAVREQWTLRSNQSGFTGCAQCMLLKSSFPKKGRAMGLGRSTCSDRSGEFISQSAEA